MLRGHVQQACVQANGADSRGRDPGRAGYKGAVSYRRCAMRLLLLLVLLSLASACERSREPAPAATPAATGAPSTVALSGTVTEPPSVSGRASSSAPTATPAKPRSKPPRPLPAAPRTSTTAPDVPEPGFDPERAPDVRPDPDDVQAVREFEAEQERRDRELLEQDTEEAALRQREEAWARERAQLARDEDDRAPVDDGFDPSREPAYDLPPEDDWQADELPPEDPYAEDGYDPDEDYRP